MQFYLSGYPGEVESPHPPAGESLPETADVLIVGAGPAGLVLAAQLAQFPGIHTVVVDRRDGPLRVGQADGVACRTVEMFEAFGLAQRLIHEGYRVNEVTFWRPDPGDPGSIVRTGRIEDVEDGLSEMPHMIVNQARMLAYLREHLRVEPFYGRRASGVAIDDDGVTVTVEHDGGLSTVRAGYVVGCDGSRSAIREAIGLRLAGDATNQVWGVMDVLAVTDFPDVRLKSVIQSERGSILIIPREGGYLVRLYVELDDGRGATPQTLIEAANRILHPYAIEVKDVGWWTVYEIGQRLCDRFDDGAGRPRVFIAGDACHTHSAKAGQGMNVSMADAWNLGWKLAAVLRGIAPPELLRTYSQERQKVAQQLIDFDREFAGSFHSRPAGFQEYFREQGRFTAGLSVRYETSPLTAPPVHQHLAAGFPLGMRFHSAPVVRLADAKPMQLGHAARADGAWRLYVFADRAGSRFRAFCDFLTSDGSPLVRFTPAGAEPDAIIDVRAVLQQAHREVPVDALPAVLLPRKGPFGLVDYEKVFCADPATEDIFTVRAVDRENGCVVVVRPDQYVANVLPLDAYGGLIDFFDAILDCR